jgi:hypothetical protein
MTQKSVKSDTDKEKSKRVNVTFDKEIWEIIKNTEGLGDGDSAKVQNICVAWLGEQGILSGIIKKRLKIK